MTCHNKSAVSTVIAFNSIVNVKATQNDAKNQRSFTTQQLENSY